MVEAKQRLHPPPQLYYGQLYGAFMKMTLSPLHQDAASSCAVSGMQACRALLLCDACLCGTALMQTTALQSLEFCLETQTAEHQDRHSCNTSQHLQCNSKSPSATLRSTTAGGTTNNSTTHAQQTVAQHTTNPPYNSA